MYPRVANPGEFARPGTDGLPTPSDMNWKILDSASGLDELVARSHETSCLIFKHSTRCSISAMAKLRLEANWNFREEEVTPYYLDLIAFRALSDAVASRFHVHHESPQILLVRRGECLLDASHLDIRVDEIREVLDQAAPAT